MEIVVKNISQRLDKFISENSDISRSRAVNLIETGFVFVNGKPKQKKYEVVSGDIVEIQIPEPVPLDVKAQNIPIEIVFEDGELLVVNKPKGMVVHPANGNWENTLVNALLFHCQLSSVNGIIRPGIVHRIDKDTSGLLLVAKTDNAHIFLSKQIAEHSVKREYRAIVCGILKENGTVNAPLGRHPKERKKQAVTEKNSKEAITHYEILEIYPKHTEVKCILETGRTHQIRVHMSYINHPVLGDEVYGKPFKNLTGQCLHAEKIGFIHPNGEYMEFTADLPEYFVKVQRSLK